MRTHHKLIPSVASGLGRLKDLAARFRRDRSGATAVQAIVMMPVIIVALWSMFSVWKVVKMRDSLHYATYQAMRYLALYPLESADNYAWTEVADKIVVTELMNNPFIVPPGTNLTVADYGVEVELLNGDYQCKDPFRVSTYLIVRVLPGGQQNASGLPNFTEFRLDDVREGEVLCE
ncbi:MAG: hypothetical protein H6648_04880 [Caldilineae bacterium]|nr:hypothetical protein [Chloroflexota bacterium]MCB9176475.1 hypothetical protein [Caldilineae bacterium]